MVRIIRFGVAAFLMFGLVGCAAPAKVVFQDKTAGSVVVAVAENTNTWPYYYKDAAKAEAAKYVSDPQVVSVVQRKVGESTINTQNVTRRDIGAEKDKPKVGEVVTASNTTTTSDQFEYHITFQSGAPMRGTGYIDPRAPNGLPGGTPVSGDGPNGRPSVRTLPTTPSPAQNLPTTNIPSPGR